MSTLGARLQLVRKERGLSQAALAKAVGSRPSSINDIESGRNKSSIYLVRIAMVLNVDPTWLELGYHNPDVVLGVVGQGALLPSFDERAIVNFATDESFDSSQCEKLYRCPEKHSNAAYTTLLKHTRDDLPQNSVLFIEPHCSYVNGDAVIVVFPDSRSFDLYRLVSSGNRTILRSMDARMDDSMRSHECRLTCTDGGELMVPVSDDSSLPQAVLTGKVFFVGLPIK